jgi:hypothetical protein
VVILIDPGMGYRNLRRCIGRVRPDVLIAIPLAHGVEQDISPARSVLSGPESVSAGRSSVLAGP